MTVKPRVIHVISGLGPGGAELMLLELARQAANSRFDPYVVSLSNKGILRPEFESIGVPVVTLDMKDGIPDPRVVRQLTKILKAERPAVVQTWMYHANLIGGLAAKASGSIPVAWGIHHTNLSPAYIKRSTLMIARACAPLSRWLPSAIVCVAEASRHAHLDLGYAGDRMLVIPNGFDTDRFRPDPGARPALRSELGLPPDTKLAGLMARFNPQKDHRNFVEAARRVAAADPAVHFVLCGWNVSWDNDELVSWIDETGFRDRFHLLGRRADTPAINAALDISCLSSESGEAFPLVIGEAMACGVPCAVTDVGDSALVTGDLGRVAPPKNPDALAAAMLALLNLDDAERTRVSNACRQRVLDNYSLAEIARRYDDLWQQLADRVWAGAPQRSAPCV